MRSLVLGRSYFLRQSGGWGERFTIGKELPKSDGDWSLNPVARVDDSLGYDNGTMPVSAEAKARFVDAFQAARPVTYRAMFGGLGFYLDDVFMAVADDDRIYLKIDPISEPKFVAQGMASWELDGKPQPYREVPEAVLNDPQDLGVWLDEARDAAVRRKKKPAKKSSSKA
jgi:DNA transformation protein